MWCIRFYIIFFYSTNQISQTNDRKKSIDKMQMRWETIRSIHSILFYLSPKTMPYCECMTCHTACATTMQSTLTKIHSVIRWLWFKFWHCAFTIWSKSKMNVNLWSVGAEYKMDTMDAKTFRNNSYWFGLGFYTLFQPAQSWRGEKAISIYLYILMSVWMIPKKVDTFFSPKATAPQMFDHL